MARPMILVSGAAPGVGKSRLSHRLAELLRSAGHAVELFEEADILVRPEFTNLIGIWQTGRRPPLEVVLDAAARYVEACGALTSEVFVQDALFPFMPSLLAWGYSDEEIVSFLHDLGGLLGDFAAVQVHLVGSAERSIARAAEREDPGWLDEMIGRASGWAGGESVSDLASLARYFTAADRRARLLLGRAPWGVLLLETERSESAVDDEAVDRLAPFLATGRAARRLD